MSLSPHMRREDPIDDIAMAQGLDGQSGYGGLSVKSGQRGQKPVVRPSLVSKQSLQRVVQVLVSLGICEQRAKNHL